MTIQKFERRYLKVSEIAQILGVDKQTLYRRIQAGTLPGVIRIGTAIRVNKEVLKQLEAGAVTPAK